jgi:hypothetical protein
VVHSLSLYISVCFQNHIFSSNSETTKSRGKHGSINYGMVSLLKLRGVRRWGGVTSSGTYQSKFCNLLDKVAVGSRVTNPQLLHCRECWSEACSFLNAYPFTSPFMSDLVELPACYANEGPGTYYQFRI